MNRIRELRERSGMKQATLADRLHVGASALSNYESGIRDPSTDTILMLCDIFDVTADYLLGRTDNPSSTASEQDTAMLRAFHAAPPTVQTAITVLLSPYIQDSVTGEKTKRTAV